MTMRRRVMTLWRPSRLLIALLLANLSASSIGVPAAATPAPLATPAPFAAPTPVTTPAPVASPAPVAECRAQSPGERPSATADNIANCVYTRLASGRVRLNVSYTYASPLGKENVWMGVDVLASGNRLKWFAYRPVSITASSGTAAIELIFGVNNPPARSLSTEQVEFFLYVGGGQIFYRKVFDLKLDWRL